MSRTRALLRDGLVFGLTAMAMAALLSRTCTPSSEETLAEAPRSEAEAPRPSLSVTPCIPGRVDSGSASMCTLPAPTPGQENVRVVVWVDSDDVSRVTLDGGRVPFETKLLDGGTRVIIEIGEPGLLLIGDSKTTWEVLLERAAPLANRERVTERLEGLQSLPEDLDGFLAGLTLHQQAELANEATWLLLGKDEPWRLLSLAERGLDAAEKVDDARLYCELVDLGLHLSIVSVGSQARADRWWEHAQRCEQNTADTRLQGSLAYYRGVHAQRFGRPREAIVELEQAIRHWDRAARPDKVVLAAERLSRSMALVGQFDLAREAIERARAALDEAVTSGRPSGCTRASLGVHAANLEVQRALLRKTAGLPLGFEEQKEMYAEASKRVETAIEAASSPGCDDPVHGEVALLARAYVELHLGRPEFVSESVPESGPEVAKKVLAALEARPVSDWSALSIAQLSADVALATGEQSEVSAALDHIRDLLAEPTRLASLADLGHVAYLAGRLAERDGDDEEAMAHYREAEQLAELQVQASMIGLEADRMTASAAEASRRIVELQAKQDGQQCDAQDEQPADPRLLEEALCTARQLRNRGARLSASAARIEVSEQLERLEVVKRKYSALRRPEGPQRDLEKAKEAIEKEEQRLWSILADGAQLDPNGACERLPPAGDDELVLLYHLDPEGHWWVYAWGDGVDLERHCLLPWNHHDSPEVRARVLLGPIEEHLTKVSRLRILASGPLQLEEFEQLSVAGRPLGQRMAVTWGVDVPIESDAARVAPAEAPLFVFPNSDESMDEFAEAAQAIGGALDRISPKVERLQGEGFHRNDVLDRARHASLLVILAHHDQEGSSSWPKRSKVHPVDEAPPRTEISSAGENKYLVTTPGLDINYESLGMASLLTMQPPPRFGVLAGCKTSVMDSLSLGTGAGLAQAMIIAGSEQVLATTDVLPFENASSIALILEQLARDPSIDLAQALRRARAETSHTDEVDLSIFRVWTQ